MRAHGALHLEIGPPDRHLGTLIVVDAEVFAEQAALDWHAEVLAAGHDDLVDEIDHDPADECSGGGEVDVARDRGFRGVRGGCEEKEDWTQPSPRLQRNSSRSGNSREAVTGSCVLLLGSAPFMRRELPGARGRAVTPP